MTDKGKKMPKVPKGFKPVHTSYKLITETQFEKPFKPLKVAKSKTRVKEFVQPVRIVSGGKNLKAKPKARKAGRRKRR